MIRFYLFIFDIAICSKIKLNITMTILKDDKFVDCWPKYSHFKIKFQKQNLTKTH